MMFPLILREFTSVGEGSRLKMSDQYTAKFFKGTWYILDNYYQWYCTSYGTFETEADAQKQADLLNLLEKDHKDD